jgi:hypothetical protein
MSTPYEPVRTASPEEIEAAAVADELRRAGRWMEAIAHLLSVVRELEQTGRTPAWPYGKLAVLYREQRRYDDEIEIMERYRALRPNDPLGRFNARISKARALASRLERTSQALRLKG